MRSRIVIWATGAAALVGCAAPQREARVLVTDTEPTEVSTVEVPAEPQTIVVAGYGDDQVERSIRQAFKARDDIDTNDIDVRVRDGEVRLEGKVNSLGDIEQARAIALGVPGVRGVIVTHLKIR